MNTCVFVSLLGLLLCSSADALFGTLMLSCKFTSLDDAVYLAQVIYNKKLLAEYDSTVGKFIGFTDHANKLAEELNNNPVYLQDQKKNLERCKTHVKVGLEVHSRSVEPSVRLSSVKATDSEHQHMLVCSAYNFYPKQIKVKWLRNGKEVTSDVTSTEELPNGNWLYQIHSYLELTPTAGESIACKVEHDSFLEPMLYEWDPYSEAGSTKIAVGSSVFVLGLIFLVAGLIFYKKKSNEEEVGSSRQPSTQALTEGE